jgi:CRISPR-associated protein Cas1
VERAVSAVGLDVYCGFLHRDVYGRMSLGLDLMEELRAVLADSVVISICNRHMLDPTQHFEARDGGVFLNEAGRKIFVQRFHARLRETVDTGTGAVTYYELCVEQARKLAACVREGKSDYAPFLTK